MTREEMWKEFENQLIRETRTPVTMSFDDAEKLTKLGIEETVAKWKRRLEQTRWISCSERLPEEYGEYLITWTTSQIKRPLIAISEGDVTGEFDHEHNRFKFEWLLESYIKAYLNVEVIAWMPLPPSYKGESEE